MPTKKKKRPAPAKRPTKKRAKKAAAASKRATTKRSAKRTAKTATSTRAAKKSAPAKKAAKRAPPAAAKTTNKATSSSKPGAHAAADPAAYVAGLEPWQRDIVTAAEALLRTHAPAMRATIKWGHPVYEQNGRPFALVRAFSKYAILGFWGRAASLPDPTGILEGTSLKHVRLQAPSDLDKPGLAELVRAALQMNGAA